MKRTMKRMMMVVMMIGSVAAYGQSKVDEQRMERDIEVAENILGTLLRQETGRRNFFPVETSGSYTPGYGVTLRIPQDGPFAFMFMAPDPADIVTEEVSPNGTRITMNSAPKAASARRAKSDPDRSMSRSYSRSGQGSWSVSSSSSDSTEEVTSKKFIAIATNFLADYGDVLSQLKPDEKVMVTNRSNEFEGGFEFRWPGGGSKMQRNTVSAEVKREDIQQLKMGKITRDQFMTRIQVVDAEPSDKLEPDLEVFSSMLGRLYSPDLSKTYYTEGNVPYERLNNYGVVFYMRVYSSSQVNNDRWDMPTIGMNYATSPERDKKVKELYPKFENDLKENVLDYARMIRSLGAEEQLTLNVKLTRCKGCGIPESIEVAVKSSVLTDYNQGKLTKEAALAKITLKKTGTQ
ncbi:MAG TPA: hypothetical protein PLX35_15775 [Cyclobacteriaceae bacterium]|nr:hypothetical protein [Cyclobacteriaceae bacterium]